MSPKLIFLLGSLCLLAGKCNSLLYSTDSIEPREKFVSPRALKIAPRLHRRAHADASFKFSSRSKREKNIIHHRRSKSESKSRLVRDLLLKSRGSISSIVTRGRGDQSSMDSAKIGFANQAENEIYGIKRVDRAYIFERKPERGRGRTYFGEPLSLSPPSLALTFPRDFLLLCKSSPTPYVDPRSRNAS